MTANRYRSYQARKASMLETLSVIANEKCGTGAGKLAALTRAKGPTPATGRAVVDTSAAPFTLAKDAMEPFRGSAFQRPLFKQLLPHQKHGFIADTEMKKIKQQIVNLEMDVIVKERENVAVLKELEMTNKIANDLKLKLPRETSKAIQISDRINFDITEVHIHPDAEKMGINNLQKAASSVTLGTRARHCPGLILMELKQAKMNLKMTTCGISSIRASVELLKSMLAKELAMLEKTRERIWSNIAKVASLEENLCRSTIELKLVKDAQSKHNENSRNILNQIKKLGLEMEESRRTTEAAKAEVAGLITDIEQTKAGIEATKAAEGALLAKKGSLSLGQSQTLGSSPQVTLSIREHAELVHKAQQSDEKSKRTIEAAVARVREASELNRDLQRKVEETRTKLTASREALKEAQQREKATNGEKLAAEEALLRWTSKQKNNICSIPTKEVTASRKTLKEILEREEVANRGKLAAEEALQWWFSKQKHKIGTVQKSTKFKNSTSGLHRTEARMFDVNGMSLIANGRPRTFSIGQILSMKLMAPEELEKGIRKRTKGLHSISLDQFLSQKHQLMSPTRTDVNNACTKFTAKRGSFGFICLSLLIEKQNKSKKNRRACSLQSNGRALVV